MSDGLVPADALDLNGSGRLWRCDFCMGRGWVGRDGEECGACLPPGSHLATGAHALPSEYGRASHGHLSVTASPLQALASWALLGAEAVLRAEAVARVLLPGATVVWCAMTGAKLARHHFEHTPQAPEDEWWSDTTPLSLAFSAEMRRDEPWQRPGLDPAWPSLYEMAQTGAHLMAAAAHPVHGARVTLAVEIPRPAPPP